MIAGVYTRIDSCSGQRNPKGSGIERLKNAAIRNGKNRRWTSDRYKVTVAQQLCYLAGKRDPHHS
jgi:hypothetical protein